jgi:hypothetical protein
VQVLTRRLSPAGPSPAPGDRDPQTARLLTNAILLTVAGCVALSALSAAVLPTVPSYDPWAWIVWGREVVDPHLSFATGGGPSWKPLPVIFTTVFGLFGGAAPTLWVITARVGGLLALVGAWRLGWRLAARLPGATLQAARLACAVAAAVAVLGELLTQDFFYYMYRGTSEPMLIATALWSVDRWLDRRHAQAFVIGVAGGLIRPEWWPFVGLYGLWLWRREPGLRALVVIGLASIPFFWFVPPWIGSGQPFLAATHAKEYNGHLGNHPELTALRRAGNLQVLPALIAAFVAVAWTWLRERDRMTLALAGGAVAWIVLVVAMVVDGYPGLERFFLPASALICVLAGVGVARVALWAGERVGGSGGGAGAAAGAGTGAGRYAALGVVVAILAISIPLASSRISTARAQQSTADLAVRILDQLTAAVNAVGGHRGVYPCRSSFAAINHSAQTALAWKLHVTLGRVGTTMRHSGVLFVGPHNSIDGGPAAISRRLMPDQMQLLASVGVWRVYRVTRRGALFDRCVGS